MVCQIDDKIVLVIRGSKGYCGLWDLFHLLTKESNMTVKPNMDCENCWLIVNEFEGDYACDECAADAEENE
tara:strand:- start:1383 stop:1595 length:213 start_codon:yes stop_codon:yes gene_type:complete